MTQKLKHFLRKIFVAIFALGILLAPGFADTGAASGLGTGDIGDYGSWATEANRTKFLDSVNEDLTGYEEGFKKTYANTHVPIEAKVGMALMNGLSHVSKILDRSLVSFVEVFLILAFMFWMMFEIYQNMRKPEKGLMDLGKDFATKGIILVAWLALLHGGLQQLFGWIMGPIVAFGSHIAGVILDAIANAGGMPLADNCAAIQQYAVENAAPHLITDAKFSGEILCVPSRLSEFYYAAILYGFGLLKTGLGASAFTFFTGTILIGTFTYAAFKFLFFALGIVVDLFLVVITLPFTAIAECMHKTTYDGLAGKIYNGFTELFKPIALDKQITTYVNAAIYFVAMSIVVAIGGSFIASVVTYNSKTHLFSVTNHNPIELILVGVLVAYIAVHTKDIVDKMGATVEDGFGKQLYNDASLLFKKIKTGVGKVYNAARGKKDDAASGDKKGTKKK